MKVRSPLLLLTLAVAAAHTLLLAGVTSRDPQPAPPAAPQAFATRTVMAQLAASPAEVAPSMNARQRATGLSSAPSSGTPKRRVRPPQQARAKKSPASREPPQSAAVSPAEVPVWQVPSAADLLALGAYDVPAELPSSLSAGNAAPAEAEAEAQEEAPTSVPASERLPLTGEATFGSAGSTGTASPAVEPASEAGAGTGAIAPATAEPASAPVPIKLPPPRRLGFTVTGKAKGFGYSAFAELLWEHDATSYRAQQEIKVLFLGSRAQTSVGSITKWGLQPQRFGDRARSERAAHFDFAAGRVTFSANTPAAAIAPGAQDRLSVFLQLGSMLAGAPDRYPVGTNIAMTAVSARSADVWTFTVQGEQTLELPVGSMVAVPLERLPRGEYDQKAQVWLAPSLGYLPVRIRLTEANGDFAELNLRSEEAP